ncbi:efflux RND transporter periplasmic adaptor subunit [Tahibacter sp.]|uniref:efflux RND transporter periplasmic adaptor subunit n=1 Tax=Tahibacter sp. TaxID=2056211 RepID=UPI0028C487B2|nr:efflux RND transporter periplasmic adaptor subunit [Tahibacter sp.]
MNVVRCRGLTALRLLLSFGLLVGLAGCGGSGGDPQATDAASKGSTAGTGDAAGNPEANGTKEDKKENQGSGKSKAILVEVASVRRRTVAARYSGTAALETPNEAQVVAKTSGVLLKLLIEEGEQVRTGQVLARIDPERPQLEVNRAEATLRRLEAELRRSEEMYARKLIATDAHDRLRFDLATQKAVYDIARLELSYTQIVAPIDGVVAQRMVKKGNEIALNQPMFRIVNNERLEAVLNVPERELSKLNPKMSASLRVDALPGEEFTGTVDRVSPVIDGSSGTFRTTVAFRDTTQRLKPGMFGRVTIVYDRRADSLTVPRAALLDEDSEPAVFVVRETKVVRTSVELGHVNGEYAEVRSGLSEGENVVTVGKVAVRDGVRVQIIERAASGDRVEAGTAAGVPQG